MSESYDMERWRAEISKLRSKGLRVTVWRTSIPLRFDNRGLFLQIPSIWMCLEGSMRIIGVRNTIDMLPGDVLVMEPGVWHSVQWPIHRCTGLHLGFTSNWSDIAVRTISEWRTWKAPFGKLRDAIEQILTAEGDSDRERVDRFMDLLISEPLIELSNTAYPIWSMMMGMWRMAYDQSVSAQDVWRKSGLSRGHSYRLFRALYGMGPARSIEVMRLELARWLLYRKCKIQDIAQLCGFTNRHIFTKRWRAQFGSSPVRFRGKMAPLPVDGYQANYDCRNVFIPRYLTKEGKRRLV